MAQLGAEINAERQKAGIAANQLSIYQNIIDALKAGDSAEKVADAIAASPWGTGALVQQIIRGG